MSFHNKSGDKSAKLLRLNAMGDLTKKTFEFKPSMVEGSRYFSYRNDKHPEKNIYISDKEAEAYVAKSSDKTLEAHNLSRADATPRFCYFELPTSKTYRYSDKTS